MSLLAKTALAGRIVDVLRDRIVAGEIAAEGPIRQDALAAELGVSKIPVREALAKLEQDGLVVSQANRGFFVSPLSAEEGLDVFDLRLRIEPDAVAAAAGRLSPGDVESAARALAALDAAAGREGAGALNRGFHVALIRPGRRPVTLQTVERLQVMAERYVVRHLQPAGRAERAESEHHALFEAWRRGDGHEARRLSTAHIAATRDDLRAELGRAG